MLRKLTKYIATLSILCGSMSMNGHDENLQENQGLARTSGFTTQLRRRSREFIENLMPEDVRAHNDEIEAHIKHFALKYCLFMTFSVSAVYGTAIGNLPLEYISLISSISVLYEDIGMRNMLKIGGCVALSLSGASQNNMWVKYLPALPGYYFARDWIYKIYGAVRATSDGFRE